jgi:hypothetical protein
MVSRSGVPLVADPSALHELGLCSLARAAIATATAALTGTRSDAVLRTRGWDDDRGARMVMRAPTAPLTIADAGVLAQTSSSFLAALVPLSAGAAVLTRALGVSFDGIAQINLPMLAPGVAGFVPEGGPIPCKSFPSSAASMTPHKLACLVELTNELLASSNAETLTRAVLVESAARGLDAVLFDDQPGSAIRPPGLRYGVSGLTPTPSGAKDQAMIDDAVALGAAVSGYAGEIIYVTAPKQAIALNLRSLRTFDYAIYPSAALADGMVIAINLSVLAAALGTVSIDSGRAVEVHEHDPAQEIVSAGGTPAAPIRSSFQTDSSVVRLRQQVSWVLRASGGVSWMEAVTW